MLQFLFLLILPFARAESVEEALTAFHANPSKEMLRLPSEVLDGVAVPRGYVKQDLIKAQLPERLRIRGRVMGERPRPTARPAQRLGAHALAAPEGKDRAEDLVDPGVTLLTNLIEMDKQRLHRASLKELPWSDSYWPLYAGLLGRRYADKHFPKSEDWQLNHNYMLAHPAEKMVALGRRYIDKLSPAEKYDLAVGDRDFSLTRFSWEKGAKHFEKKGVVAPWMGICHGWAGATHMYAPYPKRPVVVESPGGVKVQFYPQDVRALQSMLWANASPGSRFVGNRCREATPERDENGRIKDPACWDTNPATWHLSLVNQLGIQKRSFVMDSMFDAEVWNYPVVKYRYKYFNPLNNKETSRLKSALIPLDRYENDKFKTYRSPEAKYVVGIALDLTYLGGTAAARVNKAPSETHTLRFLYDLELNENYEVIGGEWYSSGHPDFVWTFSTGTVATSPGDAELVGSPWEQGTPPPSAWADAAKKASAEGAPLAEFIRHLNEASSGR